MNPLLINIQKLLKDKLFGHVGPKNVYGVKGNPYTDSQGNPTNGATTGPHLHLGVRINGEYIDPLILFEKKSSFATFSSPDLNFRL